MRRILIVNVNWLGDVLLSTPFIRAIRKKYPDAFIGCMVVPRCREILEGNPHIDELIEYDESKGHKGIFGKIQFISKIKSFHFDEAYLLHRSLTRTIIVSLAGIKKRIGYTTRKRKLFLSHKVPFLPLFTHKVEYFLNIARNIGADIEETHYDFHILDKDRIFIRNFLATSGLSQEDSFAVIHPGGNWLPKRWPAENFASLSDEIFKIFNIRVVISGGSDDVDLSRFIAKRMTTTPIIAAGILSLKQLGSLLENSKFIVTNDSGPMHIALAVRIPVVALFGPTSARITGPYGPGKYKIVRKSIECSIPCYNLICQDNRCMKQIEVEDVITAIKELHNE